MGILDKAQELAQQERDVQQKVAIAAETHKNARLTFLRNSRQRLYDFIVAELHEKMDFTIEPADVMGQLAMVKRKGQHFAVVVASLQNYTFQGSDESPEQTLEHMVFTMSRNVPQEYRTEREYIYAYATCNGESTLDEAILAFGNSLAGHLKKLF